MQTVLGFTDFKDNERVVAVVRHHWWVFVRETAVLLLFFIAPFFLVPIVGSFFAAAGMSGAASGGVIFFFASLWTLMVWHLIFASFTEHYYDMWIITNWRIINIDQKGFFRREISTLLSLDRIEDIEASSTGFLADVLNYGHLQVQTAAHEDAFIMNDVSNPTGVERIIRSAQEEKMRVFGTPSSAL